MTALMTARWFLSFALLGAHSALQAEQPLSEAEQRLFLSPHLDNTGSAHLLRYSYVRTGAANGAFADQVTLELGARVAPGLRKAHVTFLSGERKLVLPDADAASGNPVVLSFLERDVREMQQLTRGQAGYFRKRVRMALAEGALVEEVSVPLDGIAVPAWRIAIAPYVNDPLRARFERYAGKTYEFVLSDRLPGWIYEMRTTVNDAMGAPVMQDVMRYQGSEP